MTAFIGQQDKMLTLSVSVPFELVMDLRYLVEGVFQVNTGINKITLKLHLTGGFDCMTEQETALENEYVFFGMENGMATNLTIPGLSYGLVLQKQ